MNEELENPFDEEYFKVKDKCEELTIDIKNLDFNFSKNSQHKASLEKKFVEILEWYESIDIEQLSRTVSQLVFEEENKEKEHNTALQVVYNYKQQVLEPAQAELKMRENEVGFWLNPLNWFNEEEKSKKLAVEVARAKLKPSQRSYDSLQEKVRDSESSLKSLRKDLTENKSIIERYQSFDKEQSEIRAEYELVKAKEIEIEAQKPELLSKFAQMKLLLDQLEKKKSKYDETLKPYLDAVRSSKNKIKALEENLIHAQQLERNLEETYDRYEKKKIHEKCEQIFQGVVRNTPGSPGNVIRQLKNSLNTEQRNYEKALSRAKTIDHRFKMNIEKMVIDGNNLCYSNAQFIGLSALNRLCVEESSKYHIIIVFDSDIRGLLNQGDDYIRKAFPDDVEVHVVATKQKADEIILNLAMNKNEYILSNDRFHEFGDFIPVKEDRIIRHEIVGGRLIVGDLELNLEV